MAIRELQLLGTVLSVELSIRKVKIMTKYYVCDHVQIASDYRDCWEGQDIELKGEWYRILRIDWIGAYDFEVTIALLSRLTQYVN
jgi:hypothetical protein